jgi:hypothetical protein
MWPDDEYVTHVTKPAEGLVGQLIQSHVFKVLREEVGNSWRKVLNP